MDSKKQACVNSMSILMLIVQLRNANEKKQRKAQNDGLSMMMLREQTFCYMKKYVKKTHVCDGKNTSLKLKSCRSLSSQLKALSGYNR